MKHIYETQIADFYNWLTVNEKSAATIKKYIRDVRAFFRFTKDETLSKELVIDYKQNLIDSEYAARSINSMLASLNSFFEFIQKSDFCVKLLRIQKIAFWPEEKELTREEYDRLLKTAEEKGNARLSMIMQTLAGTGIRISELKFITVETAKAGEAVVSNKGKTRSVIIVKALSKKLLNYANQMNIESGQIFITRNGSPVDRRNIWAELKHLCADTDVNQEKVFPHNFRHLFARTFYDIDKDISKLANLLGHSSVNTTMVYIASTGKEHRMRMEQMGLVTDSGEKDNTPKNPQNSQKHSCKLPNGRKAKKTKKVKQSPKTQKRRFRDIIGIMSLTGNDCLRLSTKERSHNRSRHTSECLCLKFSYV